MSRQKGKGRKRLRAWHRSKSSSRRYWRLLSETNAAFKKADTRDA